MEDLCSFNADHGGVIIPEILAFGKDIVRLTDRSGTILHVLPSITRITGYLPHEVLQTSLFDTVYPDDLPGLMKEFYHLEQSPEAELHVSYRLLAKDGTWMNVEGLFKNLLHVPHIAAILTSVSDCTAVKKAEEALARSEEKYRNMFHKNPQPMWVFEAGTLRFLEVNDAAIAQYGYSKEEFLSMTIKDIRPQEDVPKLIDRLLLNTTVKPEEPNSDWRHIKKNGEVIDVQIVSYPVEFEGIKAWNTLIKDVTASKHVEQRLKESQQLLNQAQQIAQMGSWTLDLVKNKLLWTDEIYRIFELDSNTFAESYEAFLDAIHPDDREMVHQCYVDSVKNQTRYSIEHRLQMPDGRIKYVHEQGETFYDDDGCTPLRSIGTVHDITQRKKTEEILLQKEQNLHNILDSVTVPMAVTNIHTGKILFANQWLADILEMPIEQVYEQDTLAFYESTDDRNSMIQAVKRDGYVRNFPIKHRPKSGESNCYLLSVHELIFDDQEALISTVYDVSEQKRFEEELIKSQVRLHSIVDSGMDAIISIDRDSNIVLFNKSAEKMFLCTAEEALGKPVERFIPQGSRARHSEAVKQFSEGVSGARYMRHSKSLGGVRSNGEEFPIEASISIIETCDEKLSTVILRDVTEQRRFENKLHEQASLLDIVPDAIIVCNLNFEIDYWSKGAEQVYGYSAAEAIGQYAQDLSCVGDTLEFEAARQTVLSTGEWRGEFWKTVKDGKKILVQGRWKLVRNADLEPTAILITNSDITEKRSMQQQLFRAQRLESIGTLASGIAHDLNNILTPIVLGMELVRMKSPDAGTKEIVHRLITNVQRASGLISQILTFAKGSKEEREPINVKNIIDEVIKITRETFPKEIAVVVSMPREGLIVDGNSTQIHQIIMNLCINARDAMAVLGGTLTVEAGYVVATESLLKRFIDAKPGAYVTISVRDTGKGIPVELHDKIFEPFFTTKDVGKGTGIGLTTVFAIVRNHGGFITLESEVEVGTNFTIYIPESQSKAEVIGTANEVVESMHKNETILIIDDEELVRTTTANIVEAYGYSVRTASSGEEAITLFHENRDALSLVITDMMMPGINGIELAKNLRKYSPDIPIIAISGVMIRDEMLGSLQSAGISSVLLKPFTSTKLLLCIRELLRLASKG